jgi:hypothetical protein
MEKDYLILKCVSASRPSGEWNEDDFDVIADGFSLYGLLNVADRLEKFSPARTFEFPCDGCCIDGGQAISSPSRKVATASADPVSAFGNARR